MQLCCFCRCFCCDEYRISYFYLSAEFRHRILCSENFGTKFLLLLLLAVSLDVGRRQCLHSLLAGHICKSRILLSITWSSLCSRVRWMNARMGPIVKQVCSLSLSIIVLAFYKRNSSPFSADMNLHLLLLNSSMTTPMHGGLF